MSFSSLPTELVRQIIESCVPSTFRFAIYDARQSNLHSLCLVSRRFCAVAQPLLLEIVWASPRSLKRTLEIMQRQGWYNEIIETVCSDEVGGGIAQSPFDRLVQNARNLRTLVLRCQAGQLNLEPLRYLTNLSHLRLAGQGFLLSSPFTSTSLVSLTLSHENLSAVSSLLDPIYLPYLKHLAMLDTFTRTQIQQLDYTRFTRLLAGLTTLHLTYALLYEVPGWLHESISITLFNCDISEFDYFTRCGLPIQHLRITGLYLTKNKNKTILSMKFRCITAFVRSQASISLRSVYLDAPFKIVPNIPAELKSATQALVRACEANKVDLVFEEHPSDWQLDSVISKEFGRRQTESRRANAAMEMSEQEEGKKGTVSA